MIDSCRFNTIYGEKSYFIPYLKSVDNMSIRIGDCSYNLLNIINTTSIKDYDILSLPITYIEENNKDGTQITLFCTPDEEYEIEITGEFCTEMAENSGLGNPEYSRNVMYLDHPQ